MSKETKKIEENLMRLCQKTLNTCLELIGFCQGFLEECEKIEKLKKKK